MTKEVDVVAMYVTCYRNPKIFFLTFDLEMAYFGAIVIAKFNLLPYAW